MLERHAPLSLFAHRDIAHDGNEILSIVVKQLCADFNREGRAIFAQA